MPREQLTASQRRQLVTTLFDVALKVGRADETTRVAAAELEYTGAAERPKDPARFAEAVDSLATRWGLDRPFLPDIAEALVMRAPAPGSVAAQPNRISRAMAAAHEDFQLDDLDPDEFLGEIVIRATYSPSRVSIFGADCGYPADRAEVHPDAVVFRPRVTTTKKEFMDLAKQMLSALWDREVLGRQALLRGRKIVRPLPDLDRAVRSYLAVALTAKYGRLRTIASPRSDVGARQGAPSKACGRRSPSLLRMTWSRTGTASSTS